MKKIITVLGVLVGLLSAPALLAESAEELFENKCSKCHGEVGVNLPAPVLFGQERRYLEKSLFAFKDGRRIDNFMGGMMNGIAQSLSDEEIKKVTAYLAARDICDVDQKIDPNEKGFMEAFKLGREKATQMNCQHCHGVFHHEAPRLYGQKREYIHRTLQAFVSGTRPNPIMEKFIKVLSKEDLENLAVYYNGMGLMRTCR